MSPTLLPATTILDLEAWSHSTAQLFSRLRSQAGLAPKDTPSDQAWYWSSQWQALESQANHEIMTGQVDVFERVEDLLADLDA